MSLNLKLDSKTYKDYVFNYQQDVILEQLFDSLKDNKELNIFFEYSPIDEKFTSFLQLLKTNTIIEIPYIQNNNRKWNIDNIIIHENFLVSGENIIYICNNIISKLNSNCNISNFRNEFSLYMQENKRD